MKEQLLLNFSNEVDSMIERYKNSIHMPGNVGTVAWMSQCYQIGIDAAKRLDEEVTLLGNNYITIYHEEFPGIGPSLLAIAQPKLHAFIVEILPGKKAE